MRIRDVMAELRLSRATVYGMVENGEFPQPIRLSERAVAWRVEGWTSSDSLLRLQRKAVAADAFRRTLETLEADLNARHDTLSRDLALVNDALDEVRRDLKHLRTKS